jgi:hypothetical protein
VNGAGLGAQATIVVQNDTPGSITIRLKSGKPLSGHVLLATAQIQGSVTFLSAWLRDEKGMTQTPRISIKNPSDEELSAMAERRQKKTAPAAERPAVSTPVYAAPAAVAVESTPASSPVVAAAVKAVATDETSRTLAYSRRPSVLDAFHAYAGERTPAALARLFVRNDDMFRQEPPVLLTDGSSPLRLTVHVDEQAERAPQFFITGGTCSGLNRGDDGGWELEIIPERGSLAAAVTVLTGSEMIEYPLAVAPPQELFDAGRAGAGEAEYVAVANWVVGGNVP